MEKLIHIKAESKIFSVYRLVPESVAVETLIDIRDGFLGLKYKHDHWYDEVLKVNTVVFNPELPFRK